MRRARAEGERKRHALATAPGASGALQVAGKARGRVVHDHRREAADIDAHLHGGRAAQDVQLTVLETLFELAQTPSVELSGMFGGLEVWGIAGDPIIQVGPYAQLAGIPDLRIGVQPFHDLFTVDLTPRRVAPVRLWHARRIERLASFRLPLLQQIGRQAVQRHVQHARGVRADLTGWELAQHGHLVELEKITIPDNLEIREQRLPCVSKRLVDSVVAGR